MIVREVTTDMTQDKVEWHKSMCVQTQLVGLRLISIEFSSVLSFDNLAGHLDMKWIGEC